MSGGSFNYAFRWTEGFAEELEVKLHENRHKFEPLTLKKLKEIERLARYTAQLMREAEWLCSGDTSDNSFLERVADIQSCRGAAS